MKNPYEDAFWRGVEDGLWKGSLYGSAVLAAVIVAKVMGWIE